MITYTMKQQGGSYISNFVYHAVYSFFLDLSEWMCNVLLDLFESIML